MEGNRRLRDFVPKFRDREIVYRKYLARFGRRFNTKRVPSTPRVGWIFDQKQSSFIWLNLQKRAASSKRCARHLPESTSGWIAFRSLHVDYWETIERRDLLPLFLNNKRISVKLLANKITASNNQYARGLQSVRLCKKSGRSRFFGLVLSFFCNNVAAWMPGELQRAFEIVRLCTQRPLFGSSCAERRAGRRGPEEIVCNELVTQVESLAESERSARLFIGTEPYGPYGMVDTLDQHSPDMRAENSRRRCRRPHNSDWAVESRLTRCQGASKTALH